jgi:hypothetical protein
VIAAKIEANVPCDDDDRKLVVGILRFLADGKSVDDFFGISSTPHRPTAEHTAKRVWDVCLLMAPIKYGGKGLSRTNAIDEVASLNKIQIETLVDYLKSIRGKQLYKNFRKVLSSPV